MNDKTILDHITDLVHEEQRLRNDATKRVEPARIRDIEHQLTSVGTCCASGGRGANSARTRSRPRCAIRRRWKTTAAERSRYQARAGTAKPAGACFSSSKVTTS